jgi:hypothetical protein
MLEKRVSNGDKLTTAEEARLNKLTAAHEARSQRKKLKKMFRQPKLDEDPNGTKNCDALRFAPSKVIAN